MQNCKMCNEELTKSQKYFCSNSCKMKYRWENDTNFRNTIINVNSNRLCTEETRKKLSIASIGRIYKPHTEAAKLKIKINNARYWKGKTKSEITRQKMSEFQKKRFELEENRNAVSGINNHWYGKHHSENTKTKIRISILNRIEKIKNETGKYSRNIGRNENQILDEQEQKDNCKILRQFNTGIGYVVDGYCPETNTVYEVYEKQHKYKTEKDSIRESNITKHLDCNFVKIWEEKHSHDKNN